MSEKTKKTIVARHKKVAFYGVLSSDGIEKFLRIFIILTLCEHIIYDPNRQQIEF